MREEFFQSHTRPLHIPHPPQVLHRRLEWTAIAFMKRSYSRARERFEFGKSKHIRILDKTMDLETIERKVDSGFTHMYSLKELCIWSEKIGKIVRWRWRAEMEAWSHRETGGAFVA